MDKNTNLTISGVVTGMHRSGTTWFGSLFSVLDDYAVLHEPFNYNHGIKNVPRWYLDYDNLDDRYFVEQGLSSLLQGRAKFNRPFLRHARTKSILKKILGTGAERNYKDSLNSGVRNLILKDPFLIKMTPYLLSKGIPTIVIVRHPAAIFQSLNRMGWFGNMEFLPQCRAGLPAYDSDFGAEYYTARLWSELYSPVLKCHKSHLSEKLLILSHEDFFDDLVDGCAKISNLLGAGTSVDKMFAYVRRTSTADLVVPKGKKVHSLARNSKALAGSWRSEVCMDSLSVFENECGELYRELIQICST